MKQMDVSGRFLLALVPLLLVPFVNAHALTQGEQQFCKNEDNPNDCIKFMQQRDAKEAANQLAISKIITQDNNTAQFIQLKKFSSMLGSRATGLMSMLGMTLDNVNDYKRWLSTAVAVNEGYTRDPNPAVYAASNQTLANLDTQITNYLCKIDQTYCENGPNAPTRILVNSGSGQ
jgi:hypothetical protein